MNKKIISFATAGVLIALSLNVCAFAAETADKASLTASQVTSTANSENTINLSVGETTDITQNQGGFAGISWEYSIGDPSIVSLKSEKSNPPPPRIADAFTQHTWTFIANKPGTTKITFTSGLRTDVYTITVKDSNPQRKIIRLKVGGTTTISKPTGGLYGVRYDVDVLNKKIIDITDIKMIPPPEGSYDLPVTKVWTLTAKRLGITKIIVTGSSRVSDTAGASIEEYIVVVSNK